MTTTVPSHISIDAVDDEGLALGHRHVAHANAMLVGLRGRQFGGGVTITQQTRTLYNGITITVGLSDNDVSQMGWIKITVPPTPKPEPEPFSEYLYEEANPYMWIGLRIESGGETSCPPGSPYPYDQGDRIVGYPVLWVWEPPRPDSEDAEWEFLSGAVDIGLGYAMPFDEFDNLYGHWYHPFGHWYCVHTSRNMYFMTRERHDDPDNDYAPMIRAPMGDPEIDGDDLWDQVCVVDPWDGEPIAPGGVHLNEAFNLAKEEQAIIDQSWFVYYDKDEPKGWQSYLRDDHPMYVEDVHGPIVREEPLQAELPIETGYLAKIAYWAGAYYCEAPPLTPMYCTLKIITGRGIKMVIDRYDVILDGATSIERSMIPGWSDAVREHWNGKLTVEAGPNVMNEAWSDETWEINPYGGSKIVETIPQGLNEGVLPDIPCEEPVALVIRLRAGTTTWFEHYDSGCASNFACFQGTGTFRWVTIAGYGGTEIANSANSIVGHTDYIDSCGTELYSASRAIASAPSSATYESIGRETGNLIRTESTGSFGDYRFLDLGNSQGPGGPIGALCPPCGIETPHYPEWMYTDGSEAPSNKALYAYLLYEPLTDTWSDLGGWQWSYEALKERLRKAGYRWIFNQALGKNQRQSTLD